MSYSNLPARLGFGSGSLSDQGRYELTRVTNDYMLLLTLYRGNWICRKVVDVMAEDMLKDFPRISSQIKPEAVEAFNKVVGKTATEAKMLEALKWGRLFGGAIAIIVIDGVRDLAEPLQPDDILPGSYKGLIALDRWTGVYPSQDLVTDLNQISEFGLPKYYDCDLQNEGTRIRVHHSRVLRFIGRDLPNWEKQVELFWGLSELELIYSELKNWDFSVHSSSALLGRANVWAFKEPELSAAMSGMSMSNDAYTSFLFRLQSISDAMSNQGLLPLGREGELQNHSYSFGGIADVLNQFALNIAGATEYPMSKLFGRTATGLGQTNDGELQTYYDTIEQKRKRELRPQMDKLFPIIAMSTWGQIPDDLDYVFPPVRTLSDKDRAELTKDSVDATNTVFVSGIIGRQTALKRLRSLSDEVGSFSEITDEMIAAADDDVAPQIGEMEPGGKPRDEAE